MKKNLQSGQLLVIAAIFVAVFTTIIVSLVGYAGLQAKSHRQAVAREQAINIAEAGIEQAVWKFNNQQNYNGEIGNSYGNGVYNVTVTNLSGSSKIIKVDAYVPDAINPRAHRVAQVTLVSDTVNSTFNYGVQVGNGGFYMDNNSTVQGNVYSNSIIIGGSTDSKITGTAIAAGNSGTIESVEVDQNAIAHTLDSVSIGGNANAVNFISSTVGGNVVADVISSCIIGGNATYDTKSSCTIGGVQTTPNTETFSDPDYEDMPIPSSQIDTWEQEATAGGTLTSQSITDTRSLGPIKINGNLTVGVNATLNITGTIWVTGDILIDNRSNVRLDSSYGALSGVLMAGTEGSSVVGNIQIDQNAALGGSGFMGSYLLLLSQRNSVTLPAIDAANNSQTAILYAADGLVELRNLAKLKEVTAAKIHINENAEITYESGLANVNFTSGPGGGWSVLDNSWQLLQ
jgi:hypothetical protein